MDLVAIVDFLYIGETNVCQDNLDSFLAIAEELQLKGLMEQENDDEGEKEAPSLSAPITLGAVPVYKKEVNMSKVSDQSKSKSSMMSKQTFGETGDLAAAGNLDTPSKWWDSMCFFISLEKGASFPHILHLNIVFPAAFFLEVFSIIELVFSCNSRKPT